MRATYAILRKELRDAVQSRWLLAFSVTFALVALALSMVQGRAGDLSEQGFNRTTAGLINLCLLLVPLLGLVLGASTIAGERDRGTLLTLLSQPISSSQLLIGKYLGLVVAVWMAIVLGFGVAGLLMALVNPLTDIWHYALFIVLSAALATSMLSLGMLISVVSDGRLKAMALAVLAWFVLVLLYDLGAIGVALSVSSSGRSLTLAVLGNPVESVRILAVMSLEPDLQILGPLGAYLTEELGKLTSVILLSGALVAWAALPLVAAERLFRRQDL